jgi:hypothetical protein
MAQHIYTQTIIAMVWDFDKTLIKGYSQTPLFDAYGIDANTFWAEVNELQTLYEERDLLVGADTAYLNHILTYVAAGKFAGLTNSKLVDLGKQIEMSAGIPDFLSHITEKVAANDRYSHHGITVEHYVVSTGIRHLIEGSPVGPLVVRIWANEFIDQPPPPGYLAAGHKFEEEEGEIAQIGYMVDNTSKTRSVFEINKGPDVAVNARIDESDRRIPFPNMIYIADGPSDVPVFSVVMKNGGRCLGVYQNEKNFDGVKQLEDDGRVHSIAKADFGVDTQARLWLEHTVSQIADRICDDRDRHLGGIKGPAGHVV